MISNDNLTKFIDLYEKKYLIKLNRDEAYKLFNQLINIVEIVVSRKE